MTEQESPEAQWAYERAIDRLSEVSGFASAVSIVQLGRSTDRCGELASMVHSKMCAHAESIIHLRVSPLFDHSAIVGIGRMMMESTTMYFYLRENIRAEEWQLRHDLLKLHDTSSRIKLLRAWAKTEELEDLRQAQKVLRNDIQVNSSFVKLTAEQQKRLLTGEDMFVGGMRAAAARTVGWRMENFSAIYAYFSAHAHTSPMSFFRMRAHAIDYLIPNSVQHDVAAMAAEVAVSCLRRVTLDYLGSGLNHNQNM
jgi:hypothetical protein